MVSCVAQQEIKSSKRHYFHKLWLGNRKMKMTYQKPHCYFDQIPSLLVHSRLEQFSLPHRFGHWQLWDLMAVFARFAIGFQILSTGPFCFLLSKIYTQPGGDSQTCNKRWIMGLKIELCTCRLTFSSLDTVGYSDHTKCHMKRMLWAQSWLKQLGAFKNPKRSHRSIS